MRITRTDSSIGEFRTQESFVRPSFLSSRRYPTLRRLHPGRFPYEDPNAATYQVQAISHPFASKDESNARLENSVQLLDTTTTHLLMHDTQSLEPDQLGTKERCLNTSEQPPGPAMGLKSPKIAGLEAVDH